MYLGGSSLKTSGNVTANSALSAALATVLWGPFISVRPAFIDPRSVNLCGALLYLWMTLSLELNEEKMHKNKQTLHEHQFSCIALTHAIHTHHHAYNLLSQINLT